MFKRLAGAFKSSTSSRYLTGSKYIGAGALIFNPPGQILLIKNRLRDSWEYPAGGAAGRESPLETCAREVSEEVGLSIEHYWLVAVDFWYRLTPNGNLLFTFAAEISDDLAAQIKPHAREVSEWRWVSRDEALELIVPRLRSRFSQLLGAYDSKTPVYLHTGHSVV